MFQSFHKLDLQRIYNGGPWSFDNHMLVLECLLAGELPSQMSLNHINIWVQVHHVPDGFMTRVVGEQLGNFVGEFLEYDINNNTGFWRSYTRLRVCVDVQKPLKREKKVRKPGGSVRQCGFDMNV